MTSGPGPTPGSEPRLLADREEPWPVVGSRDLHRDDWLVALREDVVHPPGHPEDQHHRLVLEHPGAVVVLAVDEHERVCCLRQYRHAGGGPMIELPAGLKDAAGEEPVATAARELREEAELQAGSWKELLVLSPSAGITTEVQHVFLARDLAHATRGDFEPHGEEAHMEVFWVPVHELLEAILDLRVRESPLVAAVLAYVHLKHSGRL